MRARAARGKGWASEDARARLFAVVKDASLRLSARARSRETSRARFWCLSTQGERAHSFCLIKESAARRAGVVSCPMVRADIVEVGSRKEED